MTRLLKEPLFHFLVLGVAIFVLYGWMSGGGGAEAIVVTRGQQTNLIDTFERTWRRPPTPAEFRALVEDYVRQEIAYREAGAMELDRNDIVIRRRLRQKLELLTEDLASLAPPTDAELRAYYESNTDRFRRDARFTFEHVYFSTDRRGAAAESDARALLALLDGAAGASVDASDHGDSIGLPSRLSDVAELEVAATFGARFAEALLEVPVGRWVGPIGSGYGPHLVRVTARAERRIPPLEEVAQEVRNEALSERRSSAVDMLYAKLAERYSIRVEPLSDSETGSVDLADRQ